MQALAFLVPLVRPSRRDAGRQARNLLPSGTMAATSVFHSMCGIFLIGCLPLSYAEAFRGRIKGVVSSAFSTAAGFIKNVVWRTAVVTSEVALWSTERILLLMVIWVQFLAPDLRPCQF
jgi:hypothetical protein